MDGEGAAQDLVSGFYADKDRRTDTELKQAEAASISARRVERGDGRELAADDDGDELTPLHPVERNRGKAAVKQAIRTRKRLKGALLRRRVYDNERETKAAEQAAEVALRDHGIRHHYRPLPKLAFFASYMMVASLDRSLALRMFDQLNMPDSLKALAIEAAYNPRGYTPNRNVCTGGRSEQEQFAFDGRKLEGTPAQWCDGERAEDHPGAIRVLCCAAFLWLSKVTTRRRGYSHKVRGFGRGVFGAFCRVGKDAITGHTRGMPGALVALREVGFVQYGAPPSECVAEVDRGPTGHAYNIFWFKRSPEAAALDAMHERTAGLARVGVFARLLDDPSLIEARCREEVIIDPAEIPF